LPPLTGSKKFTLVLDLDETLIHYDGSKGKLHFRPSCLTFLKTLASKYEIVVFTAASKEYADYMIDFIDPRGVYIQHKLYRHHTIYFDEVYHKDLALLGRDLEKTIIVDNLPENFEKHKDNGIEIRPYYGNTQDTELDRLMSFLLGLVDAEVKDVRPLVKIFNF